MVVCPGRRPSARRFPSCDRAPSSNRPGSSRSESCPLAASRRAASLSRPTARRSRGRAPRKSDALVQIGDGHWFVSRQPAEVPPPQPTSEAPGVPDLNARLDLRKYSVARTEEKQLAPEPISLPRGRLSLTLLLPVGYEAGTYDLQLLDSSLTAKASASGSAEIRDYITTLHAGLDVTIVEPGSYQLAIRCH
jgi:hypothetical protein